MIRALLGLTALTLAACSSPAREATPEVRTARGPLDLLAPAIVGPGDLPQTVAVLPYNVEADVDRAGLLAEGARSSGEIALTFDDGPGGENTAEVLRILAAHRVKGAFFLIGDRLAGPGVVAEVHRRIARAIAAQGHIVGNHGLDHLVLSGGDRAWSTWQIEASARLIAQAIGEDPHYFRPPYGALGEAARAVVVERGDELVLWTIDAQDTIETDPEQLAKRLEQQLLFAGQGVVLLHDIKNSSVRALSLLLDWLDKHPRDPIKATGFTVVDLPSYLAHAAKNPYPATNRVDLLHQREAMHKIVKH